jgi:VWFA-related protein
MNVMRRTNGERRTSATFVVRRSTFVVLASFLVLSSQFFVLSSARVPSSATQEPSFRTSASELVVLPVVVTDRQGRHIPDVASSKFTVYDNGRRVPIELFTNEDAPVTIGLIIDASSSMRGRLGEVVTASMAFARSSNPQDELFVLRFNDDIADVIPDSEFLPAADIAALGAAMQSVRADGRTALYDGVMDGLEHLTRGTRARKALIVISDGGDNASGVTLDAVLARARRASAAIYTIGIYDDDDVDKNPGVLKSLAHATGGERYLPRSAAELMAACERIAREIRGGYTIGYVPPTRDGAYHRIRVEVDPSTARKLNVRTRPGYFAAGPAAQP